MRYSPVDEEDNHQASLSKMFKDIMKIEWRCHQEASFQWNVSSLS